MFFKERSSNVSLLNLIKGQFLNLPQWKLRAQMLLGEDLGSTQISIYLFLSKNCMGLFCLRAKGNKEGVAVLLQGVLSVHSSI